MKLVIGIFVLYMEFVRVIGTDPKPGTEPTDSLKNTNSLYTAIFHLIHASRHTISYGLSIFNTDIQYILVSNIQICCDKGHIFLCLSQMYKIECQTNRGPKYKYYKTFDACFESKLGGFPMKSSGFHFTYIYFIA